MKKSIKHILLFLLAAWCLLILIYISVTISASIILGANDNQDFLYFLLHGAVNHGIAIVLMLTLIIAVAISIMPRRWWQWLLLTLAVGNVAVILGYALFLPKSQPCTAQMMADHYTSHLQEMNNLANHIRRNLPQRPLDSMKFGEDAAFIESYEFDEAGRFLRLVAGSPDFRGHDFLKKFAAEHNQDDVYPECSMSTRDEQVADSMLLILDIDKNRLQDLMHKAGVIGFNYNVGTTPIELIYAHYGTSRSYSFILYDRPLQEKEKEDLNRLDSNIVLNDTVVLRCDNYYVWLEFPEDNLLHIQPELVNKHMATCFPDKQQFRPSPQ